MCAGGDCEGEGGDKFVSCKRVDCWSDDGDVLEADAVVAALEGAGDVGEGVEFWGCAAGDVVRGGVDAVEGGD